MKRIYSFVLLLFVGLLLVACDTKASLEIGDVDITVDVGETHEIEYTVTEGFTLEWILSEEGIIELEDGVITALKAGSVVVTVKVKDTDLEKSINVTVLEKPNLEIEDVEISIEVDETFEIEYTVTEGFTLEWSLSEDGIIDLEDGVITALKVGSVEITVTVIDADIEKTISVTVTEKVIAATKVTITGETEDFVGEEITLEAKVTPEDATVKEVVWSSSDNSIATVANGVVTLLAEGEVTITAQVKDSDVKATHKITVKKIPVAESVTITGETEDFVGEEITLEAKVTPEDAIEKEVIWSSSDESLATVVDGVVTLLAEGEVTITAQVKDTEVKATHKITIKKIIVAESVTITGDDVAEVGEEVKLVAKVTPEDAIVTEIIWTSSDESLATVANGVVTLLAVGEVTITAQVKDTEVKATHSIEIEAATVKEVKLAGKDSGMVGDDITLTATVLPEFAVDKDVTWSSSDETIATVKDGVVSLLKVGSVTITAKAGDVEATHTIDVVEPAAYIGEVGYLTFAEALDAAKANDTIKLSGIEFTDPVSITKSNLTITSVEGVKAVIKARITLIGANGLTFKNLEFTDKGQIFADDSIDDFVFTNNNVYDITIEPSEYYPRNRINVNAFIQLYKLAGSNIFGNITITENKFDNIEANIISIDRTSVGKTVEISNNEFTNFVLGAIRFDGGYTNGVYNIKNNLFENDELGGYNAILFRAYSASAGETQEINIEHNRFVNIGDITEEPYETHPGSAVIGTSIFNDQNVTLTISNNVFENTVNTLHIRNSGARSDNWFGFIENNEFINTMGYAFYETEDLAIFDLNTFKDDEGNELDVEEIRDLIQKGK